MCMPTVTQTETKFADATVATAAKDAAALAPDEEWLKTFDLEGFTNEIKALGKRLEDDMGPADVAHLNKIVGWGNGFAVAGLLSMGYGVNALSIICLSLYTYSRWVMVAHHTCHGGYEKCHPQAKNRGRWSRFTFGVGSLWARFRDWLDWMVPEAWSIEHNNRHHYYLSELSDPDLVENNLVDLRNSKAPLLLKYMQVVGAIVTWKWFYYAPNTYKELKLAQWRKEGRKIPDDVVAEDAMTLKTIFMGKNPFYSFKELVFSVLGPYLLFHFVLTPIPWYFIGEYVASGYTGQEMYLNALKNLLLAELLTNLHGFMAVVPNHAGNDMYRFRKSCRAYSGSFFLRQVIASVNFSGGTDVIDFLHGFLNYQIEHHLYPQISMLAYQKAAPQVREICQKYGVPYIKENIFLRTKKTIDIMVGNTSMRWFPEYYEDKFLELDAAMMKKDAATAAE